MDKRKWILIKGIFSQAGRLHVDEQAAFVSQQVDMIENHDERPEIYDKVMEMLAQEYHDHEVDDVVQASANALVADASNYLIGSKVEQFVIDSPLGEGGMGQVFLAKRYQGGFEQQVAIKFLHSHKIALEHQNRFKRERNILASMQHKNIASLIGGGRTETGLQYIIMEYIAGEPITDYCHKKQLSLRQRLKLFSQVLDAISFAHQHLVVHRDIKPSNVMVTNEGEVKLLDFGIAKLVQDAEVNAQDTHTETQSRHLTLSYASPEQVLGKNISVLSDVYGLGALLWHMLTGCTVFDSGVKTHRELEDAIIESTPERPSVVAARANDVLIKSLSDSLRGDLDTIVLKTLSKEPARRYAGVSQVKEDIHRFLNNYPILARPESKVYTLKKFISRNRLSSALTAAFIISITGFIGALIYQSNIIIAERDNAVAQATIARQTTEYLSNIFEGANPNTNDGESITAKMLLDEARDNISTLDAADEIRAELQLSLSNVYRLISEYDIASVLVSDAEKIIAAMDADGFNAFRLQLLLAQSQGDLFTILGDYELAVEKFELHTALVEKRMTQFSDSTLDINRLRYDGYYGIATAQTYLGNDQASADNYQKAVNVIEESHLSERFLGQSLIGLGHALRAIGDFEGSKQALVRGLKFERANAGGSLDLAHGLNQLASTLVQLDELAEARTYAQEGLVIRQEILPENNMEIVASMGILSNIYGLQAEYQKALELRLQMAEMIKVSLGEQHPFFGIISGVIGALYGSLKQFEQAEQYLNRGINVLKAAYGEDHQRVGIYLMHRGKLFLSQSRAAESIRDLRRSEYILASSMDGTHHNVAQVRILLARAMGKFTFDDITNGSLPADVAIAFDNYKNKYAEETSQYRLLQRYLQQLEE